MQFEIKTRITAGIQMLLRVQQVIKICRAIAKDRNIYRTIIRPVVMYCQEVWTLSKNDEDALEMWERKILSKLGGPVKENSVWWMYTNQELMNLYRETDNLSDIKKG